MSTSISVLVYVWSPDGKCQTVIQKRGPNDHEKGGLQSWSGAWQPAAHGKPETPEAAAWREIREEIGSEFAQSIAQAQLIPLEHYLEEKKVYHCALMIPFETLEKIVLHPSASEWQLVTREEVEAILPLLPHHKNGVPVDGKRYMFQDDKEALVKGFDLFDPAAH